MHDAGLYFPYIHFRNATWLKAAALYWPRMARIVPNGYPTRDSDTVKALRDELDFVVNVDPAPATKAAAETFTQLLREHGPELQEQLTVPGKGGPNAAGIAFVYDQKLAYELRMMLTRSRLGVPAAEVPELRHLEPGPHGDRWLAMDERLASVYMAVLADELGRQNLLLPTTDDHVALTAVGGWTADRVARVLLRGRHSRSSAPLQASQDPMTIGLLALDSVLPRRLDRVPIHKIIELRHRAGESFDAFRRDVWDLTQELAEFSPQWDQNIAQARLKDAVEHKFGRSRESMTEAIRSVGLEAVQATLAAKFEVPGMLTIAGVGAGEPLAVAAGAAVGALSVASRWRAGRREAAEADPGAYYLLEVKRAMAPRRTVERSLHLMQRVGLAE